jgi:hypothetical protein
VRLDERTLVRRKCPGLGEDACRDPDLPDVVEERAQLEPLQLLRLEPELLADLERESVIQRAWLDVVSSFASSAFARASTVERNVRSRVS